MQIDMRTRSRASQVIKDSVSDIVEKESLESDSSAEQFQPTHVESIEDTDDFHPILPFLSQTLEFVIPSETRYMHNVLAYVMRHLPEFGLDEPDHSNIYVALNEAISNAIRHGHKNDPGKKVVVVAEMNNDFVRFTISDQGEGFDSNQIPDPTLPDNLLQPGGRGVLLIKHLMDEVSYNDRGNQVTM